MWESKNSSVVMFESVVCLGSADLSSEPDSNSIILVIVDLHNKSCPNFMNDSFISVHTQVCVGVCPGVYRPYSLVLDRQIS